MEIQSLYRWLQKCQNLSTMPVFDRKKLNFIFLNSLFSGIAERAPTLTQEHACLMQTCILLEKRGVSNCADLFCFRQKKGLEVSSKWGKRSIRKGFFTYSVHIHKRGRNGCLDLCRFLFGFYRWVFRNWQFCLWTGKVALTSFKREEKNSSRFLLGKFYWIHWWGSRSLLLHTRADCKPCGRQ